MKEANAGFSTTTRAEANESVDRLCILVERVLESHDDMANKIRGIDTKENTALQDSDLTDQVVESRSSSTISRPKRRPDEQQIEENVSRRLFQFAFEEDLEVSAVYKKALFNRSQSSLVSTTTRSTASSVLSGLSMGDVSILAVYALPIYPSDLDNSQYYHFGDVPEQALTFEAESPERPRSTSKGMSWQRVTGVLTRTRDKRKATVQVGEPEQHVFGLPLAKTIEYAKVQIFWTDDTGTKYSYDVPLVLAKCGRFLKWKGKYHRITT